MMELEMALEMRSASGEHFTGIFHSREDAQALSRFADHAVQTTAKHGEMDAKWI